MKSIGTFLIVTLCAAGAAEARELTVWSGPTFVWTKAPSLDGVAADDVVPYGGFEISYEVGKVRGQRLHLEVGFMAGSTEANDFMEFDSKFTLETIQAGLRLDRQLGKRVRAYARADLGVERGHLNLSYPGSTATPIDDGQNALSAYAGLGAEMMVYDAYWLELVVRVEGGYFASQGLSFEADPDYADDGLAHIDTWATDLGTIDPSGPALRLSLGGRF